jgi:alkanesulfonate monooxygenase SsuD/methylene tetrahydromethanopterin reductase-like flavin-dependent oxidoreductase (luciferase family)
LQHPNFSFDYDIGNTAQIIDYLKNLIVKAENTGFDPFWVMDHFHQIPFIGKPEEPMLDPSTETNLSASLIV